MRGLVIKSLVLTVLFIGGLYSLKYFLKFSVSSIFNLPHQTQSMAFSLDKTEVDTNIVLVNIAHLDRGMIAQTVNLIAEAKPSVIAFNICFDATKRTPYDSLLFSAFKKERNVVLIHNGENCKCSNHVHYGKEEYFIPQDGVVRSFSTDSSTLSSVIVRLHNQQLYDKLKNRRKEEELINYIGNYTHFLTLHAELITAQVVGTEIFKNKIVLLGYLGNEIPDAANDQEDTYSTPLADAHSSKMYGTEISANIIHTIIQGKYITIVPVLSCFGIYFLILVFNSVLGYLAIRISQKFFALVLTILVLGESSFAAFLMITLLSQNIILDIEDLPFIILGGFLIQYFLLKFPVSAPANKNP